MINNSTLNRSRPVSWFLRIRLIYGGSKGMARLSNSMFSDDRLARPDDSFAPRPFEVLAGFDKFKSLNKSIVDLAPSPPVFSRNSLADSIDRLADRAQVSALR